MSSLLKVLHQWQCPMGVTFRVSSAALCTLLLLGCTSSALKRARREFYEGHFDKAEAILRKRRPPRRDKLLWLVERGTILHTAGKYPESNKVFLEAAELTRDLETISASRWTASLATNERVRAYRGESFEPVMVHCYLAINYLLLNDYENALVEAKRILKRLDTGYDAFQVSPFPRYLVALCYELLGLYEDAYLEYKKVQAAMPSYPGIKCDLVRMTHFLGRADEREKWLALPGPVHLDYRGSELILFLQGGRGPLKVSSEIFIPPSHRFAVPSYETGPLLHDHAEILAGAKRVGRTYRLLDIGMAARSSLDHRIKKALAKETLRKGAQEIIARQAKSTAAQVLVRLAFFAISSADTRCWQTLPGDFQVARIPLRPGTYNISLLIVGPDGSTIERRELPGLAIPPNRPAIRSIRTLR